MFDVKSSPVAVVARAATAESTLDEVDPELLQLLDQHPQESRSHRRRDELPTVDV